MQPLRWCLSKYDGKEYEGKVRALKVPGIKAELCIYLTLGFSYLVYIAPIFGIVADIVFNRIRVAIEVINVIADTIAALLVANHS